MYTTQLLQVLVVALSTVSAAQGLLHDVALNVPHKGHVLARQVDASGGSDDNITTPDSQDTAPTTPAPAVTTPSSTPVVPTPTPSPSPSPEAEPSRQQSSRPSPTPTEPAVTTPTPTPELSEKTTPPPLTSSTTPPPAPTVVKTTETKSDSNTAGQVLSTATEVITITRTDDKGQAHTEVSTTKRVSTSTPGLANPQKQGETGMSTQTRNTVIGVVVGVGGAAILAGIAFLFFRLHRRKQPEEGDGLMEYDTGFPAAEKQSDVSSSISPGSGRSPFQSTLETYHAPTQVNTASNF